MYVIYANLNNKYNCICVCQTCGFLNDNKEHYFFHNLNMFYLHHKDKYDTYKLLK